MSTINDTDQFLVQRGTTSHKQSAVDLMSTIEDTDLMLVQRGADSYKVTCKDVKDQLGGGGIEGDVNQPTVVKPKDGAGSGETVYALSDKITKIEGGGVKTCETETISAVDTVGYTPAVGAYVKVSGGDATGDAFTNIENAWDGDESTWAYFNYTSYSGTGADHSRYSWAFVAPIPCTELKALVASYSSDSRSFVGFNGQPGKQGADKNSGPPALVDFSDSITDGFLRSFEIGDVGSNYGLLYAVYVDGRVLVNPLNCTVLTFPSAQGFNCFAVGDVVNGQDYSGNTAADNGDDRESYAAAYDGDTTTSISMPVRANAVTNFPTPIRNVTSIRVFVNGKSDGQANRFKINGVDKSTDITSFGNWNTITNPPSTFDSISWGSSADANTVYELAAVEVNGSILKDGVTVISKGDSDPYTITVDGGTWSDGTTTGTSRSSQKQFSTWDAAWDGDADINNTNNYPLSEDDSNVYYTRNGGFRFSIPIKVPAGSIVSIDANCEEITTALIFFYFSDGTFEKADSTAAKTNGWNISPYRTASSTVNASDRYLIGIEPRQDPHDPSTRLTVGMKPLKIDGAFIGETQVLVGDTKLVKETPYDTTLTVATDKGFDYLLGTSWMTDGQGAPGPYTQTPYLLTSDTIESAEPRSVTYDGNWTGATVRTGGLWAGGGDIVEMFNGTTDVYSPGGSNEFATITFDPPIPCTSLQIRANTSNQSSDGYLTINGIDYGSATRAFPVGAGITTATGTAFTSIPNPPATIETLAIGWKSSWLAISGIKINGTELIQYTPITISEPGFTLTFADSTDLEYFSAGDVVQESPSGTPININQSGASIIHSSPQGLPTDFGNNLPTISYAEIRSASTDQWNNVFTPDVSANFTYQMIELEYPVTSIQFTTQGSYIMTACSADGVTWEQLEQSPAGQTATTRTATGGPFKYWYIGFNAATADNTNNYYLSCNAVPYSSVKIISVDANNSQMVVDGGKWDTSNQSQVWSDGMTANSDPQSAFPVTNAFDGDLNTTCYADQNGTYKEVQVNFTDLSDVTSVQIYWNAAGGGQLYCNGNGVDGSAGSPSTVDVTGTGLVSVRWTQPTNSNYLGVSGIKADGKLLVDAVNDSQVWSNGTLVGNRTDTSSGDLFDGNMSTKIVAAGDENASWVFTSSSTITANESIVLLLSNDGGTYGVGIGDVFKEVSLNGSTDAYSELELTNANSGITFPFTFNQIKGQRRSDTIFGSGMVGIRVDGKLLIDPGTDRGLGDTNVRYQTKGGKGDIVSVNATDKTILLTDTGDRDNRWIAENGAGIDFKVAGPQYVDSPLLTSHVELESSQFSTTPATNPDTGGPLDGLAKITWSLKPGDGAEYQLDAGTLNPYRPTGLQLNTTYTIKVKHTGVLLGDSDWSTSTTFETGASRSLNEHYMKQIKALEEKVERLLDGKA